MTERNDLPWEVRLLLTLRDADEEIYEVILDGFMEDAESGEMPQPEIQRFAETMRKLRDYDQLILLHLKAVVEQPKVEFENGRWRIND
jgi:hypothetical protein